MRITQGPMLERFATIFDIPVDEVVEWVNDYVNHPELATNPEENEKSRFSSIKGYIERRIAESSDDRIRCAIHEDRRIAA